MISQFGGSVILSAPNNDLKWCYFVIENDYLQISNSISVNKDFESLCNYSNDIEVTGTSNSGKKQHTKGNRRFSKTISTNFGVRNKD